MEKKQKWYYMIPVIGVVFGIWYLKQSFYDVVYSDYIRLVNSYLPDVWNPDKFLVRDVLTRIPINYVARIINTSLFHYSIRFDQALGLLSLGLGALILAAYCVWKKISPLWFGVIMAVFFSLNKWEMMNNGSGWVHFLAFAGFYYHYLVWDRVWSGQEKKGDHLKMLLLPWILILGVAGPYCAVYVGVLLLGYCFCLLTVHKKTKKWDRRYLQYGICVVLPFLCYLWSTAQVKSSAAKVEGTLFEYLLDVPSYFVRFFLKSLCSTVVGGEAAAEFFHSNVPYFVIGLTVGAAYLLVLWQQFRYRIYEKTLFPLILIVAGGMNHVLIVLSRWSFFLENYGMSSRYAVQFQIGVLGILLTFGLLWKERSGLKKLHQGIMIGILVLFLGGNLCTTWRELRVMPWRKLTCVERAQIALDFEQKTDDELRAAFEYRTYADDSGAMVRQALTILKENNWNVFHE